MSTSSRAIARLIPLREVVSILGGGTPSKLNSAYWKGPIPWVSPKDFTDFIIRDSIDHISDRAVTESATNLVPPGAVLVVVRSGILRRKVPIAITDRAVAINQDLKALVPISTLDSRYLALFLVANQRMLLDCVKVGATVQSMDVPRLLDVEIPLPDAGEQQRIVSWIERLRSQLGGIRALRRAARSDVGVLVKVALKALLQSSPGEAWKVHTLGDLATDVRYGLTAKGLTEPKGVLFVRVTDISMDGDLKLDDPRYVQVQPQVGGRYRLLAGDLLVARSGATAGKTCFWRDEREAVFASYLLRVRFDTSRILPEFAFLFTQSEAYWSQLREWKRGGAQPNVNATNLKKIEILVPPLGRQQEIVDELSRLRRRAAHIARLQQDSLADLEALEGPVLEQAFRSELWSRSLDWRSDADRQ
jgi:restriction endonuclease S subunit